MAEKDHKEKGLQRFDPGSSPAPSYIENATHGREKLDSRDITMPILCVVQGMTKQKSRTDPRHIPGLQDGMLFNNLTSEIYASDGEPIRVIPVLVNKHAIEFYPRPKDGEAPSGPQGIKDKNVPWDDPRCEFSGDKKPQAERFLDYLALIAHKGGRLEPIVISMSRSKFKVAKQLNGLIALTGNKPMYACAYELRSVDDTSKTGGHVFKNFKFTPIGWVTDAENAAAKDLYQRMKDQAIEVERVREDDDFPEVPDPAAQAAAAEAGSREPGEDGV